MVGFRQLRDWSFQHGVLESRLAWMSPGRILRAWMPAFHAGMTKISIFMFCRRAKAHESLRGDIHFLFAACAQDFTGRRSLDSIFQRLCGEESHIWCTGAAS